ncbi:MAG: hypothetical protein Q8L85_10505 [Alphaproteobacteria bacterium]|nr:hypothetical protein [Alphaproteobacteria bacterium]
MKKLFVALATIISVSSFAEAAKVVITNDSDYMLEVWTGKFPKPWKDKFVEAGQKLVLDLPDGQETIVKMYRYNMAAAGKNISGVVGRIMTAEAPSKDNALAWGSGFASFGTALFKGYPVKRVTLNPSQVTDGQIKHIIVTDYEHNETTIDATLSDANIVDFEDLVNVLTPSLVPALVIEEVPAPVLMIENVNDEVLVELLESASISSKNTKEEPVIEEID